MYRWISEVRVVLSMLLGACASVAGESGPAGETAGHADSADSADSGPTGDSRDSQDSSGGADSGDTASGGWLTDRYAAFTLVPQSGDTSDNALLVVDRLDGSEVATIPNTSPIPFLSVRADPSGEALWAFVNDFIGADGAGSELDEYSLDGTLLASIPAPMGHHGFDVHEDEDGLLFTYIRAVSTTIVDGLSGESMQVIYDEVVQTRDGSDTTVILDTSKAIDFAANASVLCWEDPFFDASLGRDCTHGNTLNWDPSRGTYTYSTPVNAVGLEFDETGVKSGFLGAGSVPDRIAADTLYGNGQFSFQHDVSTVGDTVWVFDNRADTAQDSAVESYSLDAPDELLVQTRGVPGDGHSLLFGGVSVADDYRAGNIIVGWGTIGCASELDADDTVVWEFCPGAQYIVAEPSLLAGPSPE